MTTTDVGVFWWLYPLDSHENGNKLMYAQVCQTMGLGSSTQRRPADKCRKRYGAASFDKGQVSKVQNGSI